MSKKLDKFVGKNYIHTSLGEVEVLKKIPKSRTRLEVKIINKGVGWSTKKRKYTGVRKPGGWMRGQNYNEGNIEEVHYEELKEIVEE